MLLNPITLVNCQWMVCRLKLNNRSDANVSLENHRLEKSCVGVAGNLRAQPAKVWANARTRRVIPML